MKIAIVFPINNPFAIEKAKPVVLAAIPYIKFSKFVNDIQIISPESPQLQGNYNVTNIKAKNKQDYYCSVLKEIISNKITFVEVHQDIKLASFLKKQLVKIYPNTIVNLIKHGEYLINRLQEKSFFIRYYYKKKYLQYIDNIYCISNYVRDYLRLKYPSMKEKFITFYNNYGHLYDNIATTIARKKEKQIIYVGKMQKAKGIVEFLEASTRILQNHTDYRVIIIAGIFSKKNKYNLIYKKAILNPIIKDFVLQNRVKFLHQLSNQEVFRYMEESQIVVVPTKRPEPFGLVCLEAHLAGCAVVSSSTGGLKEISEDNALYLRKVNSLEIAEKMETLISNEQLTKNLAIKGQNRVLEKFNPILLVNKLDYFRDKIINGK